MIYITLFLIFLFCLFFCDFNSQKTTSDSTYYLLCCTLILVMGLRYRVGMDTLNYIDTYETLPNLFDLNGFDFSEENYDPLFIILSAICRTFTNDFLLLQLVQSIAINVAVFHFFSKYANCRFVAVFFYYCLLYIYYNAEIIRASFSIVCFLYSFKYYLSRQWIRYYIFAIIAFFFHSSAIFLWILPLLRNLRFNYFFYMLLILEILFFIGIQRYMEDIFSILFLTSRIEEKTNQYLNNFDLSWKWKFYNLCLYSIFPFLLFVFNKRNLRNAAFYESMLCIHIIIGIGLTFIPIFYRFADYTMPIYILFLTEYIQITAINSHTQIRFQKVLFMLSFIIIPFLIIYTTSSSNFVADSKYYHRWYPYHSIFDPQKEPIRERMREIQFNR